jgi:hypothetical protein
LISGSINTTRPECDAEDWERKFPDEFGVLVSRPAQSEPGFWSKVSASPTMRLAAAAAIFVAIGLCIVERIRREPEPQQTRQQVASAVEMATAISLERAYRRGGIEAVEDQCRKVFETRAGESTSPSILQLLGEQSAGVKIFGGKNL